MSRSIWSGRTFEEDWADPALTLADIAHLHGYADPSGPRRRADRDGLPERPPREHLSSLRHPEMQAAFKRDWALGLSNAELGALYGFRNINSVTRAARRLGLPKRAGGPIGSAPNALQGGRWEQRGMIQVWVEEDAA